MYRIFLLLGAFVVSVALMSCGGTATTSVSNSNSQVNTNPSPLPPEFQTSPIPITVANNGNVVVNGRPLGTPIPGIDPKNAVIKVKPGGTPIPGIPDQETIRRQMQGLERPNVNSSGTPIQAPGGGMMMRKRPLKPSPTQTPQ